MRRLILAVILLLAQFSLRSQSVHYHLLDSAVATSVRDVATKEALFRQALQQLRKVQNDSIQVYARIEMGKFFFFTSSFDSAYHYFLDAEQFAKKDLQSMAHLQNMQGAALQKMEQFEASASHFIRAAGIYEELGDEQGISKVYNNLSITYRILRDDQRAEEYIRKAVAINVKRGDTLRLAQNLNNLGNLLYGRNQLDSALYYFQIAANLKGRFDLESNLVASSKNNVGMILRELGRYNEAEAELLNALAIRREIHDRAGLVSTLTNLMELYVAKRDFYKAQEVYDEAEPMLKEFGGYEIMTRMMSHAGEMYAELGQYERAVMVLQSALLYTDSLHEQTTKENILDLERRYKLGEKEKEIRDLQVAREQAERDREWTRWSVFGLSAFVVLLSIMISLNYRRLKENKKLTEQYLQEKERAENTVLFKEQTIRILSHEVRTPLNGIISLSHLLKDSCDHPDQHEMIEMINISADRLMNVISNVLDYSKFQAGKLEMELLPTDLTSICRESVDGFAAQAHLGQLEIAGDLPREAVMAKVDPQLMHSILNNLVGNAVKFTPAGGQIIIRCFAENNWACVEVKDNGIGIDADKVKMLFSPFEQVSDDRQKRAVGTGLGLSIVKLFTELMAGSVSVESEKGRGTTFQVRFPLA